MAEPIGRVVIAKAGRDSGGCFVVVGCTDEGYVLIADGKRRKLAHAKKKKIKHLYFTQMRIAGLEERLKGDRGALDAFLRKSLGSLKQDLNDSMEEG